MLNYKNMKNTNTEYKNMKNTNTNTNVNTDTNTEYELEEIKFSMNLREPQFKSLKLFSDYLLSTAGQMVLNRRDNESRSLENVREILEKTKTYTNNISEMKNFESFERNFPAYTFALATGVGKTKLMGAFVTYLHRVYKIQHFLIVTPGKTIYKKIKNDFDDPNNPKYVFNGISDISVDSTRIITTEDKARQSERLYGSEIEINIFNIQQFAQNDLKKNRGIKKLWEDMGQSYFDYLKEQNDLVVLLDEAHHYHADMAFKSFDLMDPLFALEFTATPYIGTKTTNKKTEQIKMKNIVYMYNLGDAIRDGFVKDPYIGTEADVSKVDIEYFKRDLIEVDARKLELAIHFHERAKNAIKEYALKNDKPIVKPVLLVVAKDTSHSNELKNLIDSDSFFNGKYKDKVIEIHTKLKGEEADESIEKLISLENSNNLIEIVIHVNMLKEGWDVSNVYTIAPLRESASAILTEQTIGRGLRLPYGNKTNDPLVDRLMIVVHEEFKKVIELARDSSLIQGEDHIEIVAKNEQSVKSVVKTIEPQNVQKCANLIKNDTKLCQKIEEITRKELCKSTGRNVDEEKIEEITNDNINKIARYVIENKNNANQGVNIDQDDLFVLNDLKIDNDLKKNIFDKADENEKEFSNYNNISIPILNFTEKINTHQIEDFNLDFSLLGQYEAEKRVIEERLQKNDTYIDERENSTLKQDIAGDSELDRPDKILMQELNKIPKIDYSKDKNLFLKLIKQAIDFYAKKINNENDLLNTIKNNSQNIAIDIYKQIQKHEKNIENDCEYIITDVKKILNKHNYTVKENEEIVSLDSQSDTFSKDFLYGHFKKACHSEYKFDSSDEVRFAYLLEKDKLVKKWLRPAPKEFEMLNYEPDFVVELDDCVKIVEVKAEKDLLNQDVLDKKAKTEKYCEKINENIGKFEIKKKWMYIIIPTNNISIYSTIEKLLL